MIRVEEAVKRYRVGDQVISAVDRLSLSVARGEFVSIVGHSGSGKTTLLSLMGGLTKPDSGRIVVDGDDLCSLSDDAISALRNRTIGFIFQFASLMPTLNALENVLLPTVFSSRPGKGPEDAGELLDMVGLSQRKHSYPSQLSGGEQRRVAIARALINDPGIILADEPTGDLDVDTEREVIEVFHRIHRGGTTFVMVTHNRELALEAGRVLEMRRGRIA